MPEIAKKDYIFGTHHAELERLSLQHRVWRPDVTDAWRRGGFTEGQTILDIGCGPGYASVDLAEIVGPDGKVIALDRSQDFLDFLRATAQGKGLQNISTHRVNFDEGNFPNEPVDGVYDRWVLTFLRNPKKILEQAVNNLRTGGRIVIHEYFHYRTFRFTTRCPAFDIFIDAVVEAWRAEGGEPDIAPKLLTWCEELGLTIESLRPIVHIVSPQNYIWQWPKSFVEVSPWRLADLGYMKNQQVEDLQREFAAFEADGHTRIVTPAVLEIIARK